MPTRTRKAGQRRSRTMRAVATGKFRNSQVARNSKDLIRLMNSPPITQKRMVAGGKKGLIMKLVKIAKNIRYGAIKLTDDDHQKLKRHVQKIKTLMLSRTSLNTREIFYKWEVFWDCF